MTICDVPGTAVVPTAASAASPTVVARVGFTFATEGGYAACLARGRDGGWYPERWTLGGAEPYPVSLPGRDGPERPGSGLLPLPDGRVLVCRRGYAERGQDRSRCGGLGPGVFRLAVLSPTGPGIAELPLGELALDQLRLVPLPAAPPFAGLGRWRIGPAVALAVGCAPVAEGAVVTSVWLVSGDGRAPQQIAELPGRHVGGIWLDRAGRLLALDRAARGRVKTVVLDLDTARTSPLLQIAQESNDRLVLADPDSGLLVVRSDAAGGDRLGWGVLGSTRPVRFPDCVRLPDGAVATPFALQPGGGPNPQDRGVALWTGGPTGVRCTVWRPGARRLAPLTPPPGWLAGAGHWADDGLRLPFVLPGFPPGMAHVADPEPSPRPPAPPLRRPVPLQQAPLA